MNFEQILALEDRNANKIYLHKEGLFLRCYNQSAFLFWKHVAQMKLTRRFIKKVNTHMIYLGFPEGTKKKWLRDRKVEKLDDKLFVVIMDGESIDDAEYLQFEEAARVQTETKDRYTVHTSIIEKQPVFELAQSLMLQSLTWGRNVPKTDLVPYGNEMKCLSYEICWRVSRFYDAENREKEAKGIQDLIRRYQFAVKTLKEANDIGEKGFSMAMEQSGSLFGQIELLGKNKKKDEKPQQDTTTNNP